MITPKQDFQKSEHAKGWPDVVDSRRFHMAAMAAFAQMQVELGHPADMATAAAQRWELEGAKRFLSILMQLAETGVKPQVVTESRLNYKA